MKESNKLLGWIMNLSQTAEIDDDIFYKGDGCKNHVWSQMNGFPPPHF